MFAPWADACPTIWADISLCVCRHAPTWILALPDTKCPSHDTQHPSFMGPLLNFFHNVICSFVPTSCLIGSRAWHDMSSLVAGAQRPTFMRTHLGNTTHSSIILHCSSNQSGNYLAFPSCTRLGDRVAQAIVQPHQRHLSLCTWTVHPMCLAHAPCPRLVWLRCPRSTIHQSLSWAPSLLRNPPLQVSMDRHNYLGAHLHACSSLRACVFNMLNISPRSRRGIEPMTSHKGVL